MTPPAEALVPDASPEARFPTTRWSRVARSGDPADREAMAGLCRDYWFPLYAFARRRGLAPAEAEDAVQGLLADLIERGDLAGLDRSRGRLRSFLRAALDHFLSNRRDHDRAARRGGGRPLASLDGPDAEARYARATSRAPTPEQVFERQWALTLLAAVLDRLGAECAAGGKSALFERLRPGLQGDAHAPPARAVADDLGMTEGAVRVAAHRLRARYRDLLRAEVARTTDDPASVDEEISDLLAAVAAG